MSRSLIFLISLPRSGSTLLQRMLSVHPSIYSTPEPWLLFKYALCLSERLFCCCNFSFKVVCDAQEEMFNFLKKEKYYSRLSEHLLTIYMDLVESNKPSASYFLDKTPRYYLLLNFIETLFPQAKIVFLVRNPLASLISSFSTWQGGKVYVGANWIDYYLGPTLMYDYYKKNKNKLYLVKYERLLEKPEDELQKLCIYLGIPFVEDMISGFSKEKVYLKAKVGDPTGVKKFKTLNLESRDKWLSFVDSRTKKWFLIKYLNFLGKEMIEELFLEDFDRLKLLLENLSIGLNPIYEVRDIGYLLLGKLYRKLSVLKCLRLSRKLGERVVLW